LRFGHVHPLCSPFPSPRISLFPQVLFNKSFCHPSSSPLHQVYSHKHCSFFVALPPLPKVNVISSPQTNHLTSPCYPVHGSCISLLHFDFLLLCSVPALGTSLAYSPPFLPTPSVFLCDAFSAQVLAGVILLNSESTQPFSPWVFVSLHHHPLKNLSFNAPAKGATSVSLWGPGAEVNPPPRPPRHLVPPAW